MSRLSADGLCAACCDPCNNIPDEISLAFSGVTVCTPNIGSALPDPAIPPPQILSASIDGYTLTRLTGSSKNVWALRIKDAVSATNHDGDGPYTYDLYVAWRCGGPTGYDVSINAILTTDPDPGDVSSGPSGFTFFYGESTTLTGAASNIFTNCSSDLSLGIGGTATVSW